MTRLVSAQQRFIPSTNDDCGRPRNEKAFYCTSIKFFHSGDPSTLGFTPDIGGELRSKALPPLTRRYRQLHRSIRFHTSLALAIRQHILNLHVPLILSPIAKFRFDFGLDVHPCFRRRQRSHISFRYFSLFSCDPVPGFFLVHDPLAKILARSPERKQAPQLLSSSRFRNGTKLASLEKYGRGTKTRELHGRKFQGIKCT